MALRAGILSGVITTVVAIIMVFQVLGDTSSDVGYAADNITNNGADVYPLVSFFKKKGIVLLAFMAGIALTIILSVLPGR